MCVSLMCAVAKAKVFEGAMCARSTTSTQLVRKPQVARLGADYVKVFVFQRSPSALGSRGRDMIATRKVPR